MQRSSLLGRLFLTPDGTRLRSGWRLLGQTAMLFLLLGAFGGLLGLVLPQPGLSANILLYGTIASLLAITTAVYLARRLLDRRSFVSLGLDLKPGVVRQLLAGVGIAGVMMGLIYLAEWAAGWLTFTGFAWQSQSPALVFQSLVVEFLFFIMIGWQEELSSRGYWLQNLIEGLNTTWGVLLSSAFFAVEHLLNPNVSWMAIGLLFGAGLLFAYCYLHTRRLWLPIGLHIGWNFFEGPVFGFSVSGITSFNLIQQNVHGPVVLTGGSFGPEAGLIILPALLVGVALVHRLVVVPEPKL
jgi:membrane protease YdiL (CAAX protease family)